MQHDEVIWQVIRHNHCSYMSKIETKIFCRNPYNVTGLCNRSSCPLANSRYATIREHEGVFYLYMKTIERAHMPNKLWERVKLPRNYEKALEVIDKNMMYWPKLLIHKIKQRLTKMTQMRIRMRKLALKTREKIMTMPRKGEKREARREKKAEERALLDKSIENELLARLKGNIYPDEIVNVPEKPFKKIVKKNTKKNEEEEEEEEEEEAEMEYVEDDLLEEEYDMEDLGDHQFGHDDDDDVGTDDDEEEEQHEASRERKGKDLSHRKLAQDEPSSKSKKKAKVLVEVEHEDGSKGRTTVH